MPLTIFAALAVWVGVTLQAQAATMLDMPLISAAFSPTLPAVA
jgi:hypothetical protein